MKRKTLNHILSALVVLLFSLLFVGSTKTINPLVPTSQFGNALYFFRSSIDTNLLTLGDTVKLHSGRKVVVNTARIYISRIRIMEADSLVSTPLVFKINPDTTIYSPFSRLKDGVYVSTSFNIGLPTDTNSLNPTGFQLNSVLGPDFAMWYGNTTRGYIFIDFEGMIDLTATMNGNGFAKFSFKIGAAAGAMKIILQARNGQNFQPYDVTGNSQVFMNLSLDYGALFNGLNFNNGLITDTYTINPALAKQIAANAANMVSYEN